MTINVTPPSVVPSGMNIWVRDVTQAIKDLTRTYGTGSVRPRTFADRLRADTKLLDINNTVRGVFGMCETVVSTLGGDEIGRLFVDEAGFTFRRNTLSQTLEVSVSGPLRLPAAGSSANSANVHIDTNGYLFRSTSVRRSKQDIEEIAVEDARQVLSLRPVTFRPAGAEASEPTIVGLIAEEVNDVVAGGVLEGLVGFGTEGELQSVYYDRVTLALLTVVRDQQNRIEALEAAIEELRR